MVATGAIIACKNGEHGEKLEASFFKKLDNNHVVQKPEGLFWKKLKIKITALSDLLEELMENNS